MSRIVLVLVMSQILAAYIPFWVYEFGDLSFEAALLVAIAWVAAYVAILTGEVVSVREAIRDD